MVLGVLSSLAEREPGVFMRCEASRSLSVDFHGALDEIFNEHLLISLWEQILEQHHENFRFS